ncbi:LOW QUALITY PROTEIN: hypothetical protein KIPB_006022, partial [Kipferlia bialata]
MSGEAERNTPQKKGKGKGRRALFFAAISTPKATKKVQTKSGGGTQSNPAPTTTEKKPSQKSLLTSGVPATRLPSHTSHTPVSRGTTSTGRRKKVNRFGYEAPLQVSDELAQTGDLSPEAVCAANTTPALGMITAQQYLKEAVRLGVWGAEAGAADPYGKGAKLLQAKIGEIQKELPDATAISYEDGAPRLHYGNQ